MAFRSERAAPGVSPRENGAATCGLMIGWGSTAFIVGLSVQVQSQGIFASLCLVLYFASFAVGSLFLGGRLRSWVLQMPSPMVWLVTSLMPTLALAAAVRERSEWILIGSIAGAAHWALLAARPRPVFIPGAERDANFLRVIEALELVVIAGGFLLGAAAARTRADSVLAVPELWIACSLALITTACLWIGFARNDRRPSSTHLRVEARAIWEVASLRWSNFGISIFYASAVLIGLILVRVGPNSLFLGVAHLTPFVLVAGSAALGCLVAAGVGRRRVEVGLSFVGSIGLLVWFFATYVFWDSPAFRLFGLMIAGLMGGLYLVPLRAHYFNLAKKERLAAALSFGALSNAVAGLCLVSVHLLAVGLFGIGPRAEFGAFAALALVAVAVMCHRVPESLIRLAALSLARVFYPLSVVGEKRIPRSGGVLIACNHVSFIDVILIYAASRRPVRFIGMDKLARFPWMGWIYRRFKVISVSPRKAKTTIAKALGALREGEVVCMFPEGALTRTGAVMPFKRGIEVLSRKSSAPVVPAYIDGLWGSVFALAYHRARFRKGLPAKAGASVVFGDPVSSEVVSSERLRAAVQELGVEAWSVRSSLQRSVGYWATSSLLRHPFRTAFIAWQADGRSSTRMSRLGLLAAAVRVKRRLEQSSREECVGIVLDGDPMQPVAMLAAALAGRETVLLDAGEADSFGSWFRADKIGLLVGRSSAGRDEASVPEYLSWEELGDEVRSSRTRLLAMALVVLRHRLACRLFNISRRPMEEALAAFPSSRTGSSRLSHANVLGSVCQVSEVLLFQRDDLVWCNSSMSNPIAYALGFWLPLLRGLAFTCCPADDAPELAMRRIRESAATVAIFNGRDPGISLEAGLADDLRSLRFFLADGQEIDRDSRLSYRALFRLPVYEFGTVRNGSLIFSLNSRSNPDPTEKPQEGSRSGTVGRVLPGFAARIVSRDDGTDISLSGRIGRLFLRFPAFPASEDLEHPDRSPIWWQTGHNCSIDLDGFLRFAEEEKKQSTNGASGYVREPDGAENSPTREGK